MTTADRRMTVPAFTALKAAGRKISMLTAYDYTLASLVDSAGVEGILVGERRLHDRGANQTGFASHDPSCEEE